MADFKDISATITITNNGSGLTNEDNATISPTGINLTNEVTEPSIFNVLIPSFTTYKYNNILPENSITFVTNNKTEIAYYQDMILDSFNSANIEIDLDEGDDEDMFVIPITWDDTENKYVTTITQEELNKAVTDNPYQIYFDVITKVASVPLKIRADIVYDNPTFKAVVGTYLNLSSSNAFMIYRFKCGKYGYDFGIYYEELKVVINQNGTVSKTYNQIPQLI